MKKIFTLLFICLFIFTGCNIKQISNKNINSVIDSVLSEKINLNNQISRGYKYYAPRGMRVIDNKEYNEILTTQNEEYYFYIDVISYKYQKDVIYPEEDEVYYYKKFKYYKNSGYVLIKKNIDSYYLEIYYNYARVFSVINKENIVSAVINSCYLLNSLEYNQKLIKTIDDEDEETLKSEKFKLFETTQESNFIDYIKEYDQYEEEIDESLIIKETNLEEDLNIQ
jgi:hypothetical protein